MKGLLRAVADAVFLFFGFQLVRVKGVKAKKLNLPGEVRRRITGNTMLNNDRLLNVVEATNYISEGKIPGAFVECGVWKGGSVALMAYSLMQLNDAKRDFYLFDAFDDICQPDLNVDGERAVLEVGGKEFAQGKLEPLKGIYDKKGGAGNEAFVYDLIVNGFKYPKEFLHIKKGWFQETLPAVGNGIGKIALLRLDGDWYSSTKVCLDHLYDLVVPGGVVIVDDYACYDGCKKAVDEFLASRGTKPFFIWVDQECIFWIKSTSN